MSDTISLQDTETTSKIGKPYVCILFNDEDHNMDEVVKQVMKAANCQAEKAYQIMIAAHTSGRAIVITASKERCELASAVLEEIRLGTKVEQA